MPDVRLQTAPNSLKTGSYDGAYLTRITDSIKANNNYLLVAKIHPLRTPHGEPRTSAASGNRAWFHSWYSPTIRISRNVDLISVHASIFDAGIVTGIGSSRFS
jgi:hypothetical protein